LGAACLANGGQLWDQLWDQLADQLWDQLGGQLRDQLGGQLGDQLWDQLGGQLWDQLGGQLGGQLAGQLGGQLRDQLGGQLGDQLWDQLADQLWDQLGGQLRGQLWGQLGGAWWGQWDSPWVAWWTSGKTVGASYPEHLELGRSGWEKIARSCGWWWPFEGAVVLTDRPSVIARDHEGELHRTDGPALAYRDGYGLWAIHGVRVKQQIVEAPETLKPEEILAEPNAEVRRVMIDRFGADRLMLSTNAEVRHRDIDRLGKPRELLRITVPGDEPICMVRVVNSSPEPDGDFREYLLRVPPEVESCEAAVAWTFGLGEAEYAPTVET
jgi:hypothetical protein